MLVRMTPFGRPVEPPVVIKVTHRQFGLTSISTDIAGADPK